MNAFNFNAANELCQQHNSLKLPIYYLTVRRISTVEIQIPAPQLPE
jgi:hypothetical protein